MLLDCRVWQSANGVESNACSMSPFDKNAVDAVAVYYGCRTKDELPTPSRLPQPLEASATGAVRPGTLASINLLPDRAEANYSMNIIVHHLIRQGLRYRTSGCNPTSTR